MSTIDDKISVSKFLAHRLEGLSSGESRGSYKFERIKQAKRAAQSAHPERPLLDMGIGQPHEPPHPKIIEQLSRSAQSPSAHAYTDNGGADFKVAVQRHMQFTYGVQLNPETEILHSIGSKSALSLLPAALINPGDIVLTTTPGYPVFSTHVKYYGGEVYALPLKAENNFLPDLENIPSSILSEAKVLLLNYPNNPTGAVATKDFYREVTNWAHKHNILIVQDAAYALLSGSTKPLSILSIEGAKDVAVELHSLSKSYNMTGWRLGWVCGNAELVNAYATVKAHSDSGQFLPIQEAGALALEDPTIAQFNAEKYECRLKSLVSVLNEKGFQAKMPEATFFLYTQCPRRVEGFGETIAFGNAEAFSEWLILNTGICTVPWDDVGAFVRFSVTFPAADKAAESAFFEVLKERLSPYTFFF